ncbi:6906_t:CDS:2 [Diversispora eburnea]|uniref:6906_t:CDS:1 n=1 Tax=Diversispora eburnea TaxID=1213867 RepID=A0A9N9AND9_9GLOM|nr:6906_t:CDS:2 [Diversispora eburnea]
MRMWIDIAIERSTRIIIILLLIIQKKPLPPPPQRHKVLSVLDGLEELVHELDFDTKPSKGEGLNL